jgi:hypothetical protein
MADTHFLPDRSVACDDLVAENHVDRNNMDTGLRSQQGGG